MTNFDMLNILSFMLNKDINGNTIRPEEAKLLINMHSLKLFKRKLGVPEEQQPGVPIPRQAVNSSKIVEYDLRPFLVVEPITVTAGVASFSGKNLSFLISGAPNPQEAYPLDELSRSEYYNRISNPITQPTTRYPVCSWKDQVNLEVAPNTIANIDVSYYKWPVEADFTIAPDPVTLRPVYTSITELEWDDKNKTDIIYSILRDAGMNIERADVEQIAGNIIQTGQ